jgi:hypothetical protein
MPYIKKELREEIDAEINILVSRLKNLIEDNPSIRAGTLNYTITKLIDGLYGPLEKAGYKDYNEAIGMLECCKLEFYRKAAAPYEDLKLRENGAVLDIIHKEKDSEENNSKENNSEENDDKDPFYEFVESKKWLLYENLLVAPYRTSYDVLYLDDQLRIKKGYSGILFLGAERFVWAKDPKSIFNKEVFTKEIEKNLSFSNEELEEYFNKKLPLLKQVGGSFVKTLGE